MKLCHQLAGLVLVLAGADNTQITRAIVDI